MKRFVFVVLAVLLSTASAQMTWVCADSAAGWGPRSGHTSVVFDGKMWVIGGAVNYFPCQEANDVWWSTDGDSWTCATDSAPWPARYCHSSVEFDDKMWVLGGTHGDVPSSTFFNDVWWSTDGESWTCVDSSAPWSGRGNHQSVVFNDRMWVIAGATSYSPYTVSREVWYSTDGDSWVCLTDSAPWVGREAPALAVYRDTLWLMGGVAATRFLNDIWYSTDGANWTRQTASVPWSARFVHRAVVFQDKLWITGGLDAGSNMNDAWFTADGANWTCADSSAEWLPRAAHTSLVYDSMLWVMGGDSTWDFLTTKDVWRSAGVGIEETPDAEVRAPSAATVVRSVLFLPEAVSGERSAAGARLLDISGRKVLDLKPGANDVRALAPGVYFVRSEPSAVSNQPLVVRKVVVTR